MIRNTSVVCLLAALLASPFVAAQERQPPKLPKTRANSIYGSAETAVVKLAEGQYVVMSKPLVGFALRVDEERKSNEKLGVESFEKRGVLLKQVPKGSPYALLGFVSGDVVTHISEREVEDELPVLFKILDRADRDYCAHVDILRGGKKMRLSFATDKDLEDLKKEATKELFFRMCISED